MRLTHYRFSQPWDSIRDFLGEILERLELVGFQMRLLIPVPVLFLVPSLTLIDFVILYTRLD